MEQTKTNKTMDILVYLTFSLVVMYSFTATINIFALTAGI